MEQQHELAEEMRTMEEEELLPVEKKLIAWSLGLGVILLVILALVVHVLFPVGH